MLTMRRDQSLSMLQILYAYNDWANHRVFELCRGLTDEQLDARDDIGVGTLRNTLFHMHYWEQGWYERIHGHVVPYGGVDAAGMSLEELQRRFAEISAIRRPLLQADAKESLSREIEYKDSRGVGYSLRFDDLLFHVANHGIHHRAQVLQFLKKQNRKTPGGLDFIFFRIAYPLIPQAESTEATLRGYGLQVNVGEGAKINWDSQLGQKLFSYGDAINTKLIALAETLDDAVLDQNWGIGMGSLRASLTHIYDAERWWLRNWSGEKVAFEKLPPTTSLSELRALWANHIERRNEFVMRLNSDTAQAICEVSFGGPPMLFPVVDSIVQLGGHGTHHRSQIQNMLKRSGVSVTNNDYLFTVRKEK